MLAKFAKKTAGAQGCSGVKGGRKGGGTVMSSAARDVSLRGTAYTHADEEWLHLWGDNLGGPSEAANFVAGSYAANTEMLVIEQALAFNIDKTKDLKIEVAADCSKEHVGEYVYYRLGAPKFGGKHFEHVIDLDNRTFTSSATWTHVDLAGGGLVEGQRTSCLTPWRRRRAIDRSRASSGEASASSRSRTYIAA